MNINAIISKNIYGFNQVKRGYLEQVPGRVVGPETEISNGRTTETVFVANFVIFFSCVVWLVKSRTVG